MNRRERQEYTVTCYTPGCNWEQDHPTYAEARLAGEQHNQQHGSHITYVSPPEEARRAA